MDATGWIGGLYDRKEDAEKNKTIVSKMICLHYPIEIVKVREVIE